MRKSTEHLIEEGDWMHNACAFNVRRTLVIPVVIDSHRIEVQEHELFQTRQEDQRGCE